MLVQSSLPTWAQDGLNMPETSDGSGIDFGTDASDTEASIFEEAAEAELDNGTGVFEEIEGDEEDETSAFNAADDELPSPTEAVFNLYQYWLVGMILLFLPILAIILIMVIKHLRELSWRAEQKLITNPKDVKNNNANPRLKNPKEIFKAAKESFQELPRDTDDPPSQPQSTEEYSEKTPAEVMDHTKKDADNAVGMTIRKQQGQEMLPR